MHCLSLQQPFAWAVMSGLKRIENRSWRTDYRGPLAIHAALTYWDMYALPCGAPVVEDEVWCGALLGVAELTDCVRLADLPADLRGDPHAAGPWCWLLANPRRLAAPVRMKGRVGLFRLPDEAMPLVEALR